MSQGLEGGPYLPLKTVRRENESRPKQAEVPILRGAVIVDNY